MRTNAKPAANLLSALTYAWQRPAGVWHEYLN